MSVEKTAATSRIDRSTLGSEPDRMALSVPTHPVSCPLASVRKRARANRRDTTRMKRDTLGRNGIAVDAVFAVADESPLARYRQSDREIGSTWARIQRGRTCFAPAPTWSAKNARPPCPSPPYRFPLWYTLTFPPRLSFRPPSDPNLFPYSRRLRRKSEVN